jgi:hypothetical protein
MEKQRYSLTRLIIFVVAVIIPSSGYAAEYPNNQTASTSIGPKYITSDTLETCIGDFDLDSDNDGMDLGKIARSFGTTECCEMVPRICFGDFQCDKIVDHSDLSAFAGGFGLNHCSSPIRLTHVPQYPNLNGENLQGLVSGVDPQDHYIAVYIRVEDVWWLKPYLDYPRTNIRSDGTWSCNITTGGNDAYATEIAVYLLHKNCTPGICLPCYSLPACPQIISSVRQYIGPPQRSIEFAGYQWQVKRRDFPAGPGGNYFSDEQSQVWVDDQELHLSIRKVNDTWYCSEVILAASFGYGTYIIHTRGRVDIIDPSMVIGLFTWDPEAPDESFRELDIEFARWNKAADVSNSQYVVQPCGNCPGCGDNCSRFRVDLTDEQSDLTHFVIWQPGTVEFRTYNGKHTHNPPESDLVHSWTRSGEMVPEPGKENIRFNFWLNEGNAPTNGKGDTVTITHFSWQRDLP